MAPKFPTRPKASVMGYTFNISDDEDDDGDRMSALAALDAARTAPVAATRRQFTSRHESQSSTQQSGGNSAPSISDLGTDKKDKGEDEEDDYMSEKFLAIAAKADAVNESYDQRARREKARAYARAHPPSKKDLERQAREQQEIDLATPLTSGKGRKMMEKLGLKPNETLGKSGGLKVPIPIEVKEGRGGVGADAGKKRKADEMMEAKKKSTGIGEDEFRHKVHEKKAKERLEKWVKKAVSVTEVLAAMDGDENGVGESKEEEQSEESDEESDACPAEEKLEELLLNLRKKYWYCLWCKEKFPNKEMQGCPGLSQKDHDEEDLDEV